MDWADLFDAIFGGGPSGGGGGGAPGSFAKFALTQYAAQVPYIGQYLGFYLTGREDLSELTNVDWPDEYGPSTSRVIVDEGDDGPGTRSRDDWLDSFAPPTQDATDSESPVGSRRQLLRDPNQLAENSTPKASLESWQDYQPEPLGPVRPEITLDTGPARPAPPKPEPIQEVVIHGVRPDRRNPLAPISVPPTYLPHREPIGQATGGSPTLHRKEITADSRLELHAPPRAERQDTDAQNVQWADNTVITAQPQFDRDVSDPDALAAAEGRGRIEWGDLVQFARGGYNGVISAWQLVARVAARGSVNLFVGSTAAPFVAPLVMPYMEQPIGDVSEYRLAIDPRYGGAGMMGEQLFENLVFEALPFAPRLGSIARRALRSDLFLAPFFSFMTAGGGGGAARIGRILRASEAGRAAEAAAARLRVEAEYEAQKDIAKEILLEARVPRPRSGWYESEVLGHLRRLGERGNTGAEISYRQFSAAIEALRAYPRQMGREIFWDPSWLRPR